MREPCYKCKFEHKPIDREPCDHCSDVYIKTGDHLAFQYAKHTTNYDRIIRKTPEELAELIMSIEPAACPFRDDYGDDCRFTHCAQCWLDWLNQEATE